MFRIFSIAVIGLVCSMGNAWSQIDVQKIWETDPRIQPAAINLRNVIGTAALAVVVKEVCKVGDPEPWLAVVGAVERRYLNCVKADANWTALKNGLESEEAGARKAGVPTDPPMLLFMRAISARGSRALDQGRSFCTDSPWTLMLDPEHATVADVAEAKRVAPDGEIDKVLIVMKSVLALGKDRSWADGPCDKEFWPHGFSMNR